MKRPLCIAAVLVLFLWGEGCSRRTAKNAGPAPTAYGSALVEVSGGKQIAGAGMPLSQPLVVQVNNEQGGAVAGALVRFQGPPGTRLNPATGITGADGQLSVEVTLSGAAGRHQIVASSATAAGKPLALKLEAIALGYQQTLGSELNQQYCARCHNPESSPERVSNFDNLTTKPHAFAEGEALNKISDADLISIISHGGPALGRSAEMPPYAHTLKTSEIQALLAYIRAVADPPYHATGSTYATN